jgi:hypothetical protein
VLDDIILLKLKGVEGLHNEVEAEIEIKRIMQIRTDLHCGHPQGPACSRGVQDRGAGRDLVENRLGISSHCPLPC